MSHTTAVRRAPRLLVAALGLVLAGGLVACGDDSGSTPAPSSEVPDALTVEGKAGEVPEVTWKDPVETTKLVTTTLIEGEGDTVGDGDNVLAHLWIGNGTTEAEAYSSYDGPPQMIPIGENTLPALVTAIDGATEGSRVLIVAPPADAFGDQGNADLGVGNKDIVVFIVDLLSKLTGPEGEQREPARWAPAITESGDNPSALDFSGAAKPSGKLSRTTLIQGTGAKVTKGQHIYVNYLGQVFGAKAPFDQSYERGQAFDFDLGAGNVVKGWDQGLVGVPVGSRVILQIPPKLGYGKAGQPDVGIKGTDTMYFIVDVLAAT